MWLGSRWCKSIAQRMDKGSQEGKGKGEQRNLEENNANDILSTDLLAASSPHIPSLRRLVPGKPGGPCTHILGVLTIFPWPTVFSCRCGGHLRFPGDSHSNLFAFGLGASPGTGEPLPSTAGAAQKFGDVNGLRGIP